MVVDGKVELIMVVHVDGNVIAGSDEPCKDFHAALTSKFPTNNLDELTWYTSCAFKRNWELGTLDITHKAFFESMLNRFGVNSSSDNLASPGVELGPREEGEPKGGCVLSDVAGDHDTVRYLERGACHGAPFPQPSRQALEISSEDHGIPCLLYTSPSPRD